MPLGCDLLGAWNGPVAVRGATVARTLAPEMKLG